MPHLILPDQRWTDVRSSRPRIDWSNPITVGLSAAWIAGARRALWTPSGFRLRDSARPRAAFGGSYLGPVIGPFATGDGEKYLLPAYVPPPFTVVAAAWLNSTGNWRSLASATTTPSLNGWNLEVDSGAKLVLYSGGAGGIVTSGITVSTGPGVFGVSVRGASGTQAHRFLYKNTLATASAAVPNTPASPTLQIGTAGVANDEPWLGLISAVALFNRALSDTELLMLGRDPWQIFSRDPGRVYFFPAGGAGNYNVSIAESLSAADSLSTQAQFGAALAESASAADSLSALATFLRDVAESATATDSLTATATFPRSIGTEAASAADSVTSGAATYPVTLAETATALDSISNVLTAGAALTETASASDTLSTVATLLAALAEAVTAGDSVTSSTSGSTYSVSVSEAISALDTFSAQFDLAAAVAEAANATDSTSSSAVLAAAVAEALAALDSATAAGIFGVTITGSANATDSVSAPTGFGETPASRTITVQRGGRTITVQLHGRTITVH